MARNLFLTMVAWLIVGVVLGTMAVVIMCYLWPLFIIILPCLLFFWAANYLSS